jgi:LacI family transcriptional regulator
LGLKAERIEESREHREDVATLKNGRRLAESGGSGMDSAKRVTLHDVAKAAGVSIGTVDRAIHGRRGIRDEVQKLVLEKIKELDYRPNRVARSLSIQNRKKVDLIYPREPEFFWGEISRGALAAERDLEEYGMSITHRPIEKLYGTGEADLVAAIDTAIENRPEVTALMPLNTYAVSSKVEQLTESGTGIVTMNTDLADPTKRLFFVGVDNSQLGKLAAELMAKLLRGKGHIIVISRPISTLSYELRFRAFTSLLEKAYPEIKIVYHFKFEERLDDYDLQTLENLVLSHPDLDGIYDLSGSSLADVGEIVERLKQKSGFVLVGHEMNERVKGLLVRDVITAVICQQPFLQGYSLVRMLYEYLFDNRIPRNECVYSRIDVVFKENIENRNYWMEHY